MKVVICGSRYNWKNLSDDESIKLIEKIKPLILTGLSTLAKNENTKITEIVSGGAGGVDLIAEMIAQDNNVDLTVFHPNWNKYGKRAGFLRNKKMIEYIGFNGAVLAIWDGESKGTESTINLAKLNKIVLKVIVLKN